MYLSYKLETDEHYIWIWEANVEEVFDKRKEVQQLQFYKSTS